MYSCRFVGRFDLRALPLFLNCASFHQVFGILCVDILICLLWSIIDKPRQQTVQASYGNVYAPVANTICSTSLRQPFEIAMVVWKALLLGFGILKAIQTWDVPEDVSEVRDRVFHAESIMKYLTPHGSTFVRVQAKYFAVAIYNIAVVGRSVVFRSRRLVHAPTRAHLPPTSLRSLSSLSSAASHIS